MGMTDVRLMRPSKVSLAAILVFLALTVAACGQERSPAQTVPALADRLEQVDAALADGQTSRARKAIDDLLDEAAQARLDGALTADQADRILRAATELIRALNDAGSDGSAPTDSSTPEPLLDPSEDTDEGEPTDEKTKKNDDEKKPDREDKDPSKDKGRGDDKDH